MTQEAKRSTTRGDFAGCFELTVPLKDLAPEEEALWTDWTWNETDDSPSRDHEAPLSGPSTSAPSASTSGSSTAPARIDIPTAANTDTERLDMDELAAFVEHGALPSPATANPAPPPAPSHKSSRPPPVLARPTPQVDTTTASTEPSRPKRSAPEAPEPSNRPPPAPPAIRNGILHRAGRAGKSALAVLMAHQPVIDQSEKPSKNSSPADDAAGAKRRRYE
jgi:hypothetical protein